MSDLRTAALEPPVPFGDTLTVNHGAIVALTAWPGSWARIRGAFRRAWRLVRWKMVAIITLTLSSTLLVACMAVATLNVVLRRESTNVIEKQLVHSLRPAGVLRPPFWTVPATASSKM